MGIVRETTIASPGVTALETVLVTAGMLALLVGLDIEGSVLARLPAGLDTDGSMLARLPVGLIKTAPPDPAFYAVAVVVFVTTAVETATVGGAAVPSGGLEEGTLEEEPLPLNVPPEPPSVAVKLAQVMRVLSLSCTTMLRLPMKAGVSGWRER